MAALLAQRERVFLRDVGDGERVPVLAAGGFEMGAHGVDVHLQLRHGGSVNFRGRLLTHWVVGSQDCPVTLREEPGDLVLGEVLRGGRVAVRAFVSETAGVLMLLLVGAQGAAGEPLH